MMKPENNSTSNIVLKLADVNNALKLADDAMTNDIDIDNNNIIKQTKQKHKKHKKQHQDHQQKRLLSSYSMFFQLERRRMISCDDETQQSNRIFTYHDMIYILEEKLRPKPRRRHRKTHGKVSFTEMSKIIATKWRSLNKEDKELFEYNVCQAIDLYHQKQRQILKNEIDNIIPLLESNNKSVVETTTYTTDDSSSSDNNTIKTEDSIQKDNNKDDKKQNDSTNNVCLDSSTTLQPREEIIRNDNMMTLQSKSSHNNDYLNYEDDLKKDNYENKELFVSQNEEEQNDAEYNDGHHFLSKEIQKISRRIEWRNTIIQHHTKSKKVRNSNNQLLLSCNNQYKNFVASSSILLNDNDYSLPINERLMNPSNNNYNNISFYNNTMDHQQIVMEPTLSSDLLSPANVARHNNNNYTKKQKYSNVSFINKSNHHHNNNKQFNEEQELDNNVPIMKVNYNHFQSLTSIDDDASFNPDNFF